VLQELFNGQGRPTINLPKGATLIRPGALQALVYAGLLSFTGAHAASPVDLHDFQGRVVYLDFWASWCAPCRQSFPWMQAMKDAYQHQGLTVVAVNLDHNRDDAKAFLAQFHPSFDVRFDPQGEVAERFKVKGMPTGMIIDRHGVVRFTHIGFRPVDQAAYEDQLREVLTEK
jgi:cytochrome c biogenesis protein CcmG/thiol:disulfide interchange protein DsbE